MHKYDYIWKCKSVKSVHKCKLGKINVRTVQINVRTVQINVKTWQINVKSVQTNVKYVQYCL